MGYWDIQETTRRDIQKIIEAMEKYIKGTYEANVELLQSVFHEKAAMFGFLEDQIIIGTPSLFFEDVKSRPSMRERKDPYEARIESVRISGRIANVVLRESGFRGRLCFENHFHLIKEGDKWGIVSKTFTTL